jgi:hypothetical protein
MTTTDLLTRETLGAGVLISDGSGFGSASGLGCTFLCVSLGGHC